MRYLSVFVILGVLLGTASNIARAQDQAAAATAATSQATKELIYKKIGETELKLLIDVPEDWKPGDQRPGIVFFFGGGWTHGAPKQFEDQARYLASRGMVAARADYRLKSRDGVAPDKCVEDAKSAIRYVRAHAAELGIDPQRVVAAGGSAGGHLAACTSLTPGLEAEGEQTSISSRPNALVLFNPVLNFTEASLAERVGGNNEVAAQISPTLHLTRETPPTILFFGTSDLLLAQGQAFMARSKELGHRSELFTAEGQGHGFFNRSPWKERTLKRADEFLASLGYLQGPPTLKAAE